MATMQRQAYMLDTNVFNHVLDGKISQTLLAGHLIFVTAIQAAELRATKGIERRESLLTMLNEIAPISLLVSSFAFGIEGAGFGQAEWNDGSGRFDKVLASLQMRDCKSKKRVSKENQLRDSLIAETAIKNGAILVSGDGNLREVVSEFGGRVISLNDLPPPNGERDAV